MRNALILFAVLAIGFVLYSQDKQTKLAVMEIDDKSGKLSKTLLENAAEALRSEIGATNKFVLISKDRQRQAMIKGEKKESWKECYDQSCRIQLGQALTADSILTGIITLFGGTYTLTVEQVDLAKEATIKTAKADFNGTEKGLAEAIKSIAAQISGVRKTGAAFQAGKTGEKVEEWEIGQGEEAIIKFESKPGEAVVMVDGKILCQKTPCSKMLSQGKHEIVLQRENFLPYTGVLDLKKGQTVSVQLEPDYGWVEVLVDRSGVEVLLDGKSIGKAPVTKHELSPGPHQIEINDDCYYQTGEKFLVERGVVKTVKLDLKERESGINVIARDKEGNDVNADIFLDDKKIGVAPGTHKVPLCAKELLVKSKSGQYKQTLFLKEKQVLTIDAKLKKKNAGNYIVKKEVVIDPNTDFMWQRQQSTENMNQPAAVGYCEQLSLADYDDWRLPSLSELKTLIVGCRSGTDACRANDNCLSMGCSYDGDEDNCSCKEYKGPGEKGYYWKKGIWKGGDELYFWTSSLRSDEAESNKAPVAAWSISFYDALVYSSMSLMNGGQVRCVRDLQETDPIR